MKLAAGQPLNVLLHASDGDPLPAARVALADGLAQLEWSAEIIGRRLPLAALYYPPEPGLQGARGRDFGGLHGFLADCLPEGWGELLMRRRLAKLGADLGTFSILDRLALVGRHARGALLFEPATTPEEDVDGIDLDALAEESELILLGEESGLADVLADLGGASGGARPKVHVGFDSEGRICVGDGELPPGYDAWIVKFRATADPADIGPIEMAYAAMARMAGLEMSPCRLIPSRKGPGWFATRRFDRSGDERIHMVSLAGAIEARPEVPGLIDYDMFLRAVRAITRDERDVEKAFRRMVFNLLAGNRDDHTRQHAFLMDERGEWRLAPAFDLTFSSGPGGEHYLAVAGEGGSPTRRHVDRVARDQGISPARSGEIIEQVREAVAAFDHLAREWGTGTSARKEIGARLQAITAEFDADG
jgi:serine/threonine-protein kinase HipA